MLVDVGEIYTRVSGVSLVLSKVNLAHVVYMKPKNRPGEWNIEWHLTQGILFFSFSTEEQREEFLRLCLAAEALEESRDYHTAVASLIFSRSRKEVTAEERLFAKEQVWRLLLKESGKLAEEWERKEKNG